MEKLKTLAVSLTLMSVLTASALAGETPSPPCAPGELQTPPCAAQSVNDDSTALGETHSLPASNTSLDVTNLAEAVLWALSLF